MPATWRLHAPDTERARRLAEAVHIDPRTAQILLNRRVTTPEAAARFLRPSLSALGEPWILPGMERAVSRLKRAITTREAILLFSDSDVDGITSNVILYEALQASGAVVRSQISNRIEDGYGIPVSLVKQLEGSGTRVVVLLDCGTNQAAEVRRLEEQGIDVVIIDHHVPMDGWAKPHAMVNPHETRAPGMELCTAGLAFRTAQGLGIARGEAWWSQWLDLAALGTLADCSPLTGESRILVVEGIGRIVASKRPGLVRLCEATKTTAAQPEHILRKLVPRLNACGRLGDARAIWHLLRGADDGLTEEWLEASRAAHDQTKQMHRRLIAEAQAELERTHFKDQYVMVVSRPGWPQGMMGPLASQLAQRFGRPAIAVAMDGTMGVGSGRSIPDFNLLQAVQACQSLLVRFGGHAQACGLTVDRTQLEEFRRLVNEQGRVLLGRNGLIRTRAIDLELGLEELDPAWVEELRGLAPFGHGNPRPAIGVRQLAIEASSARSAVLCAGDTRISVRGWFPDLEPGERYDAVVGPDEPGTAACGLTVSDVRASAELSAPVPT